MPLLTMMNCKSFLPEYRKYRSIKYPGLVLASLFFFFAVRRLVIHCIVPYLGALGKRKEERVALFIMSTIHCTSIGSFSLSFFLGKISLKNYQKSLSVTLAYLLCTMLLSVAGVFNISWSEWVHHIFLFPIVVFSKQVKPKLLARGLFSEFALIFLNPVLFMKEAKLTSDYATLFTCLAVLAYLGFFFLRVINFTQVFLRIIRYGFPFYGLLFFPILLVNYYWFFLDMTPRAFELLQGKELVF